MPKPIRAILCDVDGTIIDSFRHGLHKLRIAAEAVGLPYDEAVERTAIEHWGVPLNELFRLCWPTVTKAQMQVMTGVFDRLDHESTPTAIEGVHATLDLLGELGVVFTIVTSRDSKTLELILRNDGLHGRFLHQATEDSVEFLKPDPRVFACTIIKLREHGIEADECLFIGDTYQDYWAGTRFGMRTVIVKTGPLNGSRHDIPEGDHIDSFAELPDWLSRNNLLATASPEPA